MKRKTLKAKSLGCALKKRAASGTAVGLFIALAVLWTGCPNTGTDKPGPDPEPTPPALVSGEALQLDGLFDAPANGATPDDTLDTEGYPYTGTIAWQTAAGTEVSGTFADGTQYKAVLTLTPKEGCTFDGLAANAFSYAGAVSVTSAAGGSGSLVVTVLFPATGKTLVSDLALDNYVTAPVRDTAPDTTELDADQYSGTIEWQTADSSAVEGTFAASTVYQAIVTLSVKENYTFEGLQANSFTYAGVTSITGGAGSGADEGKWVVTIVFKATAAEGEDTTVSMLNLTDKVTAPVKGAAPDTTPIDTVQYTGAVVWKTLAGAAVGGTFDAYSTYRAVVTLTAKDNFTFDGVAANTFTYTFASAGDGAGITHAAGSGKTLEITIQFPRTEETTVSLLDLTSLVTAPETGAAPNTTKPPTDQYSVYNIVWQTAEGGAVSGTFAASTVYKAVVTLTPKMSFTFNGVAANTIIHSGASNVSHAAGAPGVGVYGNLEVTITFNATAAEGSLPVTVAGSAPLSTGGTVTAYSDPSMTQAIEDAVGTVGSDGAFSLTLPADKVDTTVYLRLTETGHKAAAEASYVYDSSLTLSKAVTVTAGGVSGVAFATADKPQFILPFDGTLANGTGYPAAVTFSGTPSYAATGSAKAIHLDYDEYVSLGNGFDYNESFTVGFWMRLNGTGTKPDDAAIFSNKNWGSGGSTKKGFVIFHEHHSAPTNDISVQRSDTTNNKSEKLYGTDEGVTSWVHVAVRVDKAENKMDAFINGVKQTFNDDAAAQTVNMTAGLTSNSNGGEPVNSYFGQAANGDADTSRYNTAANNADFWARDFVLVNAVLTDEAIAALADTTPSEPSQPQTRMPATANAAATKTTVTQESVSFTLNNEPSWGAGITWRVYDAGDALLDTVTASNSGNTLTLTENNDQDDVPAGIYKVTAQDTGANEAESEKLTLEVKIPVSTAPQAASTQLEKNPAHPDYLEFTLDNDTQLTGTWTVYAASAGAEEVADVSAAITSWPTLKLSHASYLPVRTYYVALTETGKSVSQRLALEVTAGTQYTTSPTVVSATVTKSAVTAAEVEFTLNSEIAGTWRVYSAATQGTENPDGVTILVSGTSLKLRHETDVPASTYYVTVQQLDKRESTPRLELTVETLGASRTPQTTGTDNVVRKTAQTQASVAFTLSNDAPYESGLVWTVFNAATNGNDITNTFSSVSNSGNTLTLAHASDVPAGTYYVAVTETGKTISGRKALTVKEWNVVTVEFSLPGDETINLTVPAGSLSTAAISWSGATQLVVTGPYASTRAWYLDGALVYTSSYMYTLYAQNVGVGTHNLTYQYLSGGKLYSKTVIFTVTY